MRSKKEVGRSALAVELRNLPSFAKKPLAIDPSIIAFIDVVVTGCLLIADESDERDLFDRLTDLDGMFGDDVLDAESVAQVLQSLEAFKDGKLPIRPNHPMDRGLQKFILRLVGAAAYRRLAEAVKLDAVPVLSCVRRGLRWFLPFTVAVDDCSALLTPKQVEDIYRACNAQTKTGPMASLFEVFHQLDGKFERAAEAGITLPRNHEPFDLANAEQLAADLRSIVTSRSRDLVTDLSQQLAAKIQGARDALEHSADPVSQAANSITELIDRLLRQAMDHDTQLSWVRENLPEITKLTYMKDGITRVTKLGQALCFAYGGARVSQRSAFTEIAAAGLVAAREKLQKLKHADSGSDLEKIEVLRLLNSVQACLLIMIRLTWVLKPDADLEILRRRFTPAVV